MAGFCFLSQRAREALIRFVAEGFFRLLRFLVAIALMVDPFRRHVVASASD